MEGVVLKRGAEGARGLLVDNEEAEAVRIIPLPRQPVEPASGGSSRGKEVNVTRLGIKRFLVLLPGRRSLSDICFSHHGNLYGNVRSNWISEKEKK